MEKLSLFFILIFMATICSAQIADTLFYMDEDLIFQAIENPGEEILVETNEKIIKLKPIFKKEVEIKDVYIFYKEEHDNVYCIVRVRKEVQASHFVLFSLLSVFLMIVSNILHKIERYEILSTALISPFALFLVIISAVLSFSIFATLILATAVLAFLIIFPVLIDRVKICKTGNEYGLASLVFCIFTLLGTILMFV